MRREGFVMYPSLIEFRGQGIQNTVVGTKRGILRRLIQVWVSMTSCGDAFQLFDETWTKKSAPGRTVGTRNDTKKPTRMEARTVIGSCKCLKFL